MLKKLNKSIYIYVVLIFVLTRVMLILIENISNNILPSGSYFLQSYENNWVNYFLQWDGAWYLSISEQGYYNVYSTHFLPVYPIIVKFLRYIFAPIPTPILGIITSNISFIIALIILYKIIIVEKNGIVAKYTIFSLLIFPTSYVFSSFYTESIFLLLIVLSYYSIKKNNLFMSLLFAGFATATRINGLVAYIFIIIENYIRNKKKVFRIISFSRFIIYICLSLSIPLLYLWFLKTKFNIYIYDYFTFWREEWNIYFLNPLTSVYLNIFHPNLRHLGFNQKIDLVFVITIAALTLHSYKTQRKSLFIYTLVSFIIFISVNSYTGFPRYCLTLFPLHMHIGELCARSKLFLQVYTIVSIGFGVLFFVMFASGYWIA